MSMKPVLHSFAYALDFLREQVGDIEPAEMVAQPNGIVNHPAWVIGHLTWACELLGGTIGIAPWLPEGWQSRFGTGSVPVADVDQYETKEIALAMLTDAEMRITFKVDGLHDRSLDAAFPDESLHYVFPTIRHALTQVLVGHTAYHVAQVSLWRKAMGKPPIERAFE